jgi:hypothetical protein
MNRVDCVSRRMDGTPDGVCAIRVGIDLRDARYHETSGFSVNLDSLEQSSF